MSGEGKQTGSHQEGINRKILIPLISAMSGGFVSCFLRDTFKENSGVTARLSFSCRGS